MEKVTIYSMGPLSCSVCAEKNLTPEEVAQEVNQTSPAGTTHGWQISEDEKFKEGNPNPCVCEQYDGRLHYLLVADMAHTTKKVRTMFIHNLDMSGDVTIKNSVGQLDVNGEDIVSLVLDCLRNERISQLEQMNHDQLKKYLLNK